MSQVPGAGSSQSNWGGGGDPVARGRVAGPAIGLMITAGVGIFFQLLGLLFRVLGMGLASSQFGGGEGRPEFLRMFAGTMGIAFGLIGIVVGVVILLGAIKMKNLESYGFAMTASILAMIPCISPCCLIGLPIGIWAIVVLSNSDVKQAFRS